MTNQGSLEAINARLARAVHEAIVNGLQGAASDVYRVFRLKETGTCIVLRTVEQTDDGTCVYGPAGFQACLKWVNDNTPVELGAAPSGEWPADDDPAGRD